MTEAQICLAKITCPGVSRQTDSGKTILRAPSPRSLRSKKLAVQDVYAACDFQFQSPLLIRGISISELDSLCVGQSHACRLFLDLNAPHMPWRMFPKKPLSARHYFFWKHNCLCLHSHRGTKWSLHFHVLARKSRPAGCSPSLECSPDEGSLSSSTLPNPQECLLNLHADPSVGHPQEGYTAKFIFYPFSHTDRSEH